MDYAGCDQNIMNWDILNLFVPGSEYDMEVVWLVSSYVLYVWENIYVRNADVKLDQFFGFLTYKYKEHQNLSSLKLKQINGIS